MSADPCGLWAICPGCAYPLTISGGGAWCERDGCVFGAGYKLTGATFPIATVEPCPMPATTTIRDAHGGSGQVCDAHARCWERVSEKNAATSETHA